MLITKIKDIFFGKNVLSLMDYLNLLTIEDDVLIGVNGDFTICYKVEFLDINYLTDDEILNLFKTYKQSLDMLKENITLSFVIQNREGNKEKIDEYLQNISSDIQFIKLVSKWKEKQFKNSFILNRKFYLFITKHTYCFGENFLKQKNIYKPIILNIDETIHKKVVTELKEESKNFTDMLAQVGVKFIKMNNNDILNYIYKYINPSRSEFLEYKNVKTDQTLRSQVCFNSCENNFEDIKIDGVFSRGINLYYRPNEISYKILFDFINNCPAYTDIVINIDIPNQEKIKNILDRKERLVDKISDFSFKKNLTATLKKDDYIEFQEDTFSNSEKFYNLNLNVIVHARDRINLTQSTNETLQSFKKLGDAEGVIDDMNHLPLFLTALPCHSHLNFLEHPINTSISACFVPPSSWQGTKLNSMLFKSENDELVSIDLFQHGYSSAMNAIILGQQGSGKSFTANYFLTNFLSQSQNNHVIVIDIGGSYKKLTELVDGSYIEVDLSGKYSFNPFPSRELAYINNEVDNDVIEFLTALIQKMVDKQKLTGQEKIILERAINTCYELEKPSLKELFNILSNYNIGGSDEKQIANNFAKELDIWVTGRYSKLFQDSSFDANARFVAFDLQKLPEDLQGIVFFIIQSAIEKKLLNKNLKKIVVIDEAWKFFNDDVGSVLIINLYKTIRKHGGLVWSISQSARDFLNTKAADAIITNSPMKLILRMQSDHDLLEKFMLNEKEILMIKSLRSVPRKYNEVFLRFGENRRVLKIEPSKLDYWICTKNANDDIKEENMRLKFPNLSYLEILEKLAEEE